ncbi:MAG: Arm DNA-binding domain [Cyanobacteriota bacterium]|jgi:hypothetical protein
MHSDRAIQSLRSDPERPGTKHPDRDGLYLWVARSGSKTWRKDYRWQGARRTFTIGAYPAVVCNVEIGPLVPRQPPRKPQPSVQESLVLHERGVIDGAEQRQPLGLDGKAATRTTAKRTNIT